jgi:glycosyltransferase involved in cell wall biosynthesis
MKINKDLDFDFDVDFYKKNYSDLNNMCPSELIYHYKNYGIKEGRFSSENQIKKYEEDNDIDLDFYKKNYLDLNNMCTFELIDHYKNHGIKEGRFSSEKEKNFFYNFYELYPDFNIDYFKIFNPELISYSKKEILQYYYIYKNINIFDLNEIEFNKKNLEMIDFKTYSNIKNIFKIDLYDIYDKKTFLKYYSKFDIIFYKDKYLSDINMNEMDIFIHYHTIGKKNQFLENNINYNQSISIVMAYYNNRKPQTLETLRGFQNMYANKYNFEVIIVDDNSSEENRLEEDIKQFSFSINLIVISPEEKGDRINPCTAYNKGFKEAKGNIIIIQNPECYHQGDIINHTLKNLTEQDYFSYSCYASNSFEITDKLLKSDNPYKLITNKEFDYENFKIINLSWYNHPTIPNRNVGYHFCSSIYKSKLDLIGGFDERFAEGYCFDDDELLLSIKYNLQLNIKIIDPEICLVIHQYHIRNDSFNVHKEADTHPIKKKWLKNKQLYEDIKQYHEDKQFNYPKLMHLYWDGNPLSFLNLITVLSFNEYHKFWKINVFVPIIKTETISWKTHEQKIKYTGKDYFNKLYDIPNVFIHKIDLDQIGFYNDASEVIKSDYFRYYILQEHGGLWSDFDIIYTASVEDKMNFKEDTVIFKGFSYQNPKNKNKLSGYAYFPIGLFLCKNNNKFFNFILKSCINYYNSNEYQSIGAVMWNTLFHPNGEPYIFEDNIIVCNEEYYLPFAWNELDNFLIEENNTLPDNNIGIHWFNGADNSKKYVIQLDNNINNFKPKCYLDKFVYKYIKKISIVMAYYNRKEQLLETIKSIKKSKYKNIEIIIVDDNSDENERINTFIETINDDLDIKVITIDKYQKTWINPCIPYNIGIKEAKGDIIIIQNPEIMHVYDCISFVNDNLKQNDWLTLNCYGSPNFEYNNLMYSLNDDNKFNFINKNINLDEYFKMNIEERETYIGGNSVIRDNVGGWLNHYLIHFVAYHYFGAIYKTDLIQKMKGGFNDIFANGIGADDDEFIKRIIFNKFNFKINKFEQNNPFVIHQYHTKPTQMKDYNNNINLFKQECIKMGFMPENDICIAPKTEIPMSRQIIITTYNDTN